MASGSGGKILLGCGTAFVLVCLTCAGIAAFLGPGTVSWVRGVVADRSEWSAFAESWRPPAPGAGATALFPATVGEFRRAPDTVPEDPGTEWDGPRAVYASGELSVDVFVTEADEAARERIVARLREGLNEGHSYQVFTDLGGPQSFVVGPPRQQGLIWWHSDWMVVVRVQGSADPAPFLRSYLEAIRGRGGGEVA